METAIELNNMGTVVQSWWNDLRGDIGSMDRVVTRAKLHGAVMIAMSLHQDELEEELNFLWCITCFYEVKI